MVVYSTLKQYKNNTLTAPVLPGRTGGTTMEKKHNHRQEFKGTHKEVNKWVKFIRQHYNPALLNQSHGGTTS